MPTFPLEPAYRAERAAFLATVEAVDPETFDHGPTLCDGWAPRDVLGHLLGIDRLGTDYLRGIGGGNAQQVERARATSRDDLLAAGRRWAAAPAAHARALSAFLLGDVSIHHQDVLRANGIAYEAPDVVRRAIFREGVTLSGTRLLRYKLIPTDGLSRPKGFGKQEVRGSCVALGLWLSGRAGLDDEVLLA